MTKASKTSRQGTLMTVTAAGRVQAAAAKHPSSRSAQTRFALRAQRAAAGNVRRGTGPRR